MLRLVPFELGRIWRKKSFMALTAVLLVINAFMLWYLNEPRDEYSPPLSAYKSIARDMSGLSDDERREFLSEKSSLLDNIDLVESYFIMQSNLSNFLNVSGYDNYIRSIEQNKNRLSEISIFQQSGTDKYSFSSRNIEKSWLDHKDLNSENIRFAAPRGIKLASENMITDLFCCSP